MMNYTTINVGDKEYKLCLNIKAMCEVEKRLGDNPINVILNMKTQGKLASTQSIVIILHGALQTYNHGISVEDTYVILDKYLAEGHQYADLLNLVVEIFETSGIIKDDDADSEEKN